MKKLILYGLNSLAEEIVRISLLESEYKISYICVDQKYKNGSFYQGVPIIAFEALDTLDMEQFEILITFGYTSMNKLKMSKFRLCKRQGYTLTKHPFIQMILEKAILLCLIRSYLKEFIWEIVIQYIHLW